MNLRCVLRSIFVFSTTSLDEHERKGVAIVAKSMIEQRWLVLALISSAAAAAIFEGGSIGLLGVAVAILIGDATPQMPQFFGNLGESIDLYIGTFSTGELFLTLVVIVVLSQVIKNLLLYACDAAQIGLSYRLRRDLQRRLTSHVMAMSYNDVSKYPAGTLAKYIDQAVVVSETLTQLGHVLRAVMMTLAYALIMVIVSPSIALATVGIILLFWLALNKIIHILNKLAVEATAGEVSVSRWTFEYLYAPRLLRLFNATDYASDVINTTRDSELLPGRKIDLLAKAIPKAVELFTVIGAGTFLVGGYLFAGDNAKTVIPIFFVYVLILFRLRPLVKAFNEFRVKIANILPRAKIIAKLLDTKTEIVTRKSGVAFSGLKEMIRFDNVSFTYPDTESYILKNINCSIPRGNTVAIVGPSGAGKSTMVDLLLGLYSPTSGAIVVDDTNLSHVRLQDWRDHIGVVDQEIFLLNTTVRDNICFGRPDATQEEIEKAAITAYAHEFISELEEGYDAIIGDRGFRLSGGQQQRLALARALLREPDILVLDEATSSLDSISEGFIQRALDEMHNKRTVVVVAHRLSTIVKSDWILVIDNGYIVEQGDMESLIKKEGHFSRIWSLQSNDATNN